MSNDMAEMDTCEFCNKTCSQANILRHIGKNKDCKSHYGPRFKAMMKRKTKERKGKYFEGLSMKQRNKVNKRRRQLYANSQEQKEKKRQVFKKKQEQKKKERIEKSALVSEEDSDESGKKQNDENILYR